MKKDFEQPIIELINIETEDIIKTSTNSNDTEGSLEQKGDNWPW